MKSKLKFIIPIVIAVIAIIVAALCIDFTPQERADVSSIMSTAQKYLIENQYEQAIAEFNKVIEIEPKNADAYLGLAEAYVGMGDTEKAIEVLEKGYAVAGDERLKKAIDNFLSNFDLNGNINTDTLLSDDIVSEQKELFEVEEEMVSFIVPYKIEESGEEFYSEIDIDTVYYENFEISSAADTNGINYCFMLGCPNYHYGVISIGTLDYSKWNFNIMVNNNKPKAIESAVSIHYTDNTPIWTVKDKYNKNFKLIEREYYSKKGLEYVDEYTYNENGQVITISNELENRKFKYDSNGNITEINSDGYIIKYEYDLNGNLLKEAFDSTNYTEYTYDSNGNCLTEDKYIDGNLSYSYVYTYDSNGSLIECIHQLFLDTYNEKQILKYDQFGNVFEFYSNGRSKYEYEYDSNNKLIKIGKEYFSLDNTIGKTTTTYQYDDNGKLVKETSEFSDKTYIYDSAGLLQEIHLLQIDSSICNNKRYEYKYDSQGNRIKCNYYNEDEWKGSKECTEFIRIDIPKSVFEEVLEK